MFLVALRILIILAISYLFVLLVAKLVSLFHNSNNGQDFGEKKASQADR